MKTKYMHSEDIVQGRKQVESDVIEDVTEKICTDRWMRKSQTDYEPDWKIQFNTEYLEIKYI